ncbi:COP1-interacting protein 7 [Camellia lanceoleosa]|uniref:COP1-interacting protein 7 n=1 Tax=Camellia lanceoleosa TaxID=1840588 RepID=A0ACC0GWX3_9ERIC|nr:COP1-interacting protein 7 [Camellia lanceoleosa]
MAVSRLLQAKSELHLQRVGLVSPTRWFCSTSSNNGDAQKSSQSKKPPRNRRLSLCDLIISANGKTEKIASGLLNPFLAHLKTAQDQIAKGGYSILLEPEPGNDRTWFTKGTVERFVRFVSTPEILERVYTIESEMLQIEEAIVIQGNDDMGLSTVEDKHAKPVGSSEGNKTVTDANEEKAIVLYKPDSHPPEANGSIAQEGNSKVQLLKVLEIRKSVLQKEQGMAFAHAVVAAFDIDHMAPLVSFVECLGASRLMDACSWFIDLWKGKHETRQWLENEAAEAMSNRSDFSAMNASGIMLSSMANKQNESHGDLASEDNGKAAIDASADLWKGKHETGQWLEIEAAEAMSNRSDFSAINASGIMLSSMANKQNESHGDLASEDNGKAAIDASAGPLIYDLVYIPALASMAACPLSSEAKSPCDSFYLLAMLESIICINWQST